jgi:hypothetical protein
VNQRLAEAIERRQRNEGLGALRKLAKTAPRPSPADDSEEQCDLCGRGIPSEHRHMLNLHERQMACVCDTCWAQRSGDAEYRPVGNRTLWLEDFKLPEAIWAAFQIPIGLAFFLHSSVTDCVVALYPSPAGATESELHFASWNGLVELNPVLEGLEPDAEALVVNRMSGQHEFAIAPIDRCYMLVGLIKANWQGISGGTAVADAVESFFGELRAAAVAA